MTTEAMTVEAHDQVVSTMGYEPGYAWFPQGMGYEPGSRKGWLANQDTRGGMGYEPGYAWFPQMTKWVSIEPLA